MINFWTDNGAYICVPATRIVYMEGKGRTLTLHLDNGQSVTIADLENLQERMMAIAETMANVAARRAA